MTDWIEFSIPVVAFAGSYLIVLIALRVRGLRLLNGWGAEMTAEKVAAWRRLRRWQFVFVNGLLLFTVPMLILTTTQRYLDHRLDPSLYSRHHYFWSLLILAIFIGGGLLSGFAQWKKIWDHKYDLPRSH